MTGKIFIGKTLRPGRIAGDKDGNVINKTETGFQSATGVKTRRLLRANRKIIDQHFGRRITQFVDDLFTGGFFLQGQEMCAVDPGRACASAKLSKTQPIFTIAPVSLIFSQKTFSAIRRRKNGLADIESHFAAIDIKGGNHFDVLGLVRADLRRCIRPVLLPLADWTRDKN